jgi:hypothetical protein
MGKMYTLDKKLLCSSPEIRIGEKVYPVDDRKNTVIKVTKLFNDSKGDVEKVDEALELAFGEKFKEIDEMDLSFAAYQKLFELVIAAMTGEEPKDEDSFPEQ